MADMKPPKRGGKPRRITTDAPPGGRYTPGARKGKSMPTGEERRQQRVTEGIRARRGLAPLLQGAGGDPEIVEAAQLIESMPGGPELLYSYAAEQLLNQTGAGRTDTKQIRLYEIGGYVEKAEGGLAQAAETTRRGGRNGDSMLVHMTPEEFETIEAMWGKADINPDTGMPEYGFLSKIWKKVKKAVKKVFSSEIFQVVAPIALSIFAPGLGSAIGGALGMSGTTASVVGNALLRGGMSAAGGGDFMQGAITGAISGGLGDVAGGAVQKVAPGLSDSTAAIAGSALASGMGAELTGGDFASGAMSGALTQMMQPAMEQIAEGGREVFGLEAPAEGGIFATRPPETIEEIDVSALPRQIDLATGEPIAAPAEVGPPAPTYGEPGGPAGPPEGPVVTPPPGGTTAPAPAPSGGQMDALIRYGLPLMAGMGAMGEYEEGQPPPIPPHMLEPLPLYESQRQFIGPTDPNAYYRYGVAGAPVTAESLFITPDPFAGETGTPTAPTGGLEAAGTPVGQGIRGMIATGQVIPAAMVRGQGGMLRNAGYTQGQDGNWYPPGQQQLGQGTGFAMGGANWYDQNADVARTIPTVARAGGYTEGPGSGRSDEIPARLSDGEYVIDAETVALLGDGSGKHGAERLDEMRRNLRKHKAKNLKKGEFTHKARSPESYMPRLRAAAGRA